MGWAPRELGIELNKSYLLARDHRCEAALHCSWTFEVHNFKSELQPLLEPDRPCTEANTLPGRGTASRWHGVSNRADMPVLQETRALASHGRPRPSE